VTSCGTSVLVGRGFPLALACSCAVAALGCTSRRESALRDSSSLTILYAGGDEQVLGPSWDDAPKFLVFLPLVETNERGEPEGRLAERWSHSRDFREWTFHLPQVAQMLQRALDAVDLDDADQAYRALAPSLQADLPVTFVAPSVLTTVAHRRLRGLSSPYRTRPLSHMDEWWLENGR